MDIVAEWTEDLRKCLGTEPHEAAEVRIGVFYTGVRLADGDVGVAFTPRELGDVVCCPKTAAAAPPAGRMVGRDAWELARYAAGGHPLKRAVGVAALNALSALAIARHGVPGGEIKKGVDALEAVAPRADDRVAMVGSFAPFIKELRGRVAELWVVDKHPEALKPDELALWRPPTEAARTLSSASVVIISGSALVEGRLESLVDTSAGVPYYPPSRPSAVVGGIESLLDASAGARVVALAGPTASPWPPPFFRRGIAVLGGIRVLDGPRLMTLLSEGGSGYFFEDVAEKISIIRSEPE